MPLTIDGTQYYSADDVLAQAAVSRQTFWRWRQGGLVPEGRLYRGRHLVFTADELENVIKVYKEKYPEYDHDEWDGILAYMQKLENSRFIFWFDN